MEPAELSQPKRTALHSIAHLIAVGDQPAGAESEAAPVAEASAPPDEAPHGSWVRWRLVPAVVVGVAIAAVVGVTWQKSRRDQQTLQRLAGAGVVVTTGVLGEGGRTIGGAATTDWARAAQEPWLRLPPGFRPTPEVAADIALLSLAPTIEIESPVGGSLKLAQLPRINAGHLVLRGQEAVDEYTIQLGPTLPVSRLEIHDALVSRRVVQKLGAMDALLSITLHHCRIDPTTLTHLSRNRATPSRLLILDFEGTAIGDVGVGYLSRLPQLSNLNLRRSGVTDASCRTLTRMPLLTRLDLRECPITEVGADALADLPPQCRLQIDAPGDK